MQPTPVFLPGESHGQRSLESYSPWGHKELDTIEHTHTHTHTHRSHEVPLFQSEFMVGKVTSTKIPLKILFRQSVAMILSTS